jgi:hypothetical protein
MGLIRSAPAKMSTGALMHGFTGSPHEQLLAEIQGEILTEWGDGFDIESEFDKVLADMADREREQKIDALLKKSEREGWSEQDKILYRQLMAAKA